MGFGFKDEAASLGEQPFYPEREYKEAEKMFREEHQRSLARHALYSAAQERSLSTQAFRVGCIQAPGPKTGFKLQVVQRAPTI